jgi:predicted small lipoprotein YifL
VKRALIPAILLTLLLPLLLAGCGALGPSVPPADDWTTQAAAPTQTATQPAQTAQAARVVSAARRALTATLGIQVYWNSWGTTAEQEADANRIFNYVVSLGANSVGINFYFYTNGRTPTRVYGVPGSTPSPATIAMVASIARLHGLRVLIRPLLNEANLIDSAGDWRGSIEPSVDTWFASYWAFLKPYLAAARGAKATAFDIGTELDSLASDSYNWTVFEAATAQVFPDRLEYADNYSRWQELPSYEPVPDAAVDAYPQLGLGDDATVAELTAAWVGWLHSHPASVLRGTVLQEVAIAAVAGVYAEPAKTYPSGTPLDISVQRKWFAAACAAAKLAGLAGLYFYDINSIDQPNDNAATAAYAPGSFIDRSADKIRACFASGWH